MIFQNNSLNKVGIDITVLQNNADKDGWTI